MEDDLPQLTEEQQPRVLALLDLLAEELVGKELDYCEAAELQQLSLYIENLLRLELIARNWAKP